MWWPRAVAFTSRVRAGAGDTVEGAQIHPGKRLFPGGKRQLRGQLAAGMTSPRMLRLLHLSQPLIQVRHVARSHALLHVPGAALTLLSSACGFVNLQVTRGDRESPVQASGPSMARLGRERSVLSILRLSATTRPIHREERWKTTGAPALGNPTRGWPGHG